MCFLILFFFKSASGHSAMTVPSLNAYDTIHCLFIKMYLNKFNSDILIPVKARLKQVLVNKSGSGEQMAPLSVKIGIFYIGCKNTTLEN